MPPPKRPTKRTELDAWLRAKGFGEGAQADGARVLGSPVLGLADWAGLRTALAPISDSYLRRLLRELGAPLDPLVEGVRQEDLEALERSLLALLDRYEAGERAEARRRVIEAKDHARLAEKKPSGKSEMILWMLTWLENPVVFRPWLALRKQALEKEDTRAGS